MTGFGSGAFGAGIFGGSNQMADLSAVQTVKNILVRKTLNCSVFLAGSSATAPTAATLFDSTSGALQAGGLTGFTDLGWLTVAGPSFTRDINVSDVEGLQGTSPVRSDVTSDVISVQVSGMETNKQTLALGTGADAAGLTAGSNGVITITKPKVASQRGYRLIAIAQDNLKTTGEPFYLARFMPSAVVTGYEEQSYGRGDDPILTGLTFKGNVDDTLATDHQWFIGGEGAKTLKTAMGFS